MSSATTTMDGEATVTSAELGWAHINWGLGLFVTGFLTGFIPILHYIPGAVAAAGGDWQRQMDISWLSRRSYTPISRWTLQTKLWL